MLRPSKTNNATALIEVVIMRLTNTQINLILTGKLSISLSFTVIVHYPVFHACVHDELFVHDHDLTILDNF